MLKELINHLSGKKILILGFGREGRSSYQLIRKFLPDQQLFIADERKEFWKGASVVPAMGAAKAGAANAPKTDVATDPAVTLIDGAKYLSGLENYDLILKSPGISFVDVDTTALQGKITSQLELLLEFFDVTTIGITGTKGKSTTSTLIYEVIHAERRNVMLLGNIGVPVFERLEEITPDTTLVLEMSSHQLEFMEHSPHIAVLINAFEEHLDHYKSFADYVRAKCNIYKHQGPNDYFFYGYDNAVLCKFVQEPTAKTFRVSLENRPGSDIYREGDGIYLRGNRREELGSGEVGSHDEANGHTAKTADEPELLYDTRSPRQLIGDYSLGNIMFVLGVAKVLGLDLKRAAQTIADFKPLKHRLEFVGEFGGVKFYDNSIATIPAATIEVVRALGDVDSLIIGGMDRGIDYNEFVEFLNQSAISNVICMPETGYEIAKKISGGRAILAETLEEAVKIAKDKTAHGKSCLLSPAAASYNAFKNFEEKGDLYQKLVRE